MWSLCLPSISRPGPTSPRSSWPVLLRSSVHTWEQRSAAWPGETTIWECRSEVSWAHWHTWVTMLVTLSPGQCTAPASPGLAPSTFLVTETTSWSLRLPKISRSTWTVALTKSCTINTLSPGWTPSIGLRLHWGNYSLKSILKFLLDTMVLKFYQRKSVDFSPYNQSHLTKWTVSEDLWMVW